MQSSLILGWQKTDRDMKEPTSPQESWEHMVMQLQNIWLQVYFPRNPICQNGCT